MTVAQGANVQMPKNAETLLATAELAWNSWRALRGQNARNETAFTVMVIEPILCALGWQRLHRDELLGTGAYYQWPRNHQVDLAMLRRGMPLVLGEFTYAGKRGSERAEQQLMKNLETYRGQSAEVRLFLTGWGGETDGTQETGLAIHQRATGKGRHIEQIAEVPLDGDCRHLNRLAAVAYPVVCNGLSPNEWLDADAVRPEPYVARCNPHEVRIKFQELLEMRLRGKISQPLQPREGVGKPSPPTPTGAYYEIPGLLPKDWGITFGQNQTINELSVSFYEGSSRNNGYTLRLSFDHAPGMSPFHILAEMVDIAMPLIEKHRQKAIDAAISE